MNAIQTPLGFWQLNTQYIFSLMSRLYANLGLLLKGCYVFLRATGLMAQTIFGQLIGSGARAVNLFPSYHGECGACSN